VIARCLADIMAEKRERERSARLRALIERQDLERRVWRSRCGQGVDPDRDEACPLCGEPDPAWGETR